MVRRGELDEHADWLMLQSNKDYRAIAASYRATFGTTVAHSAIMRWYKRRSRAEVEVVARAAAVERATAEVLEGEWVRNLNEIRDGFARAKEDGDEEGMRRWTALAQRQVEMLLKGYNAPQIVAAPVIAEDKVRKGDTLREWAKRILDQTKPPPGGPDGP